MGLKQNLSDLMRIGDLKDAIIEIIEAKIQLKKIEFQEKAEVALSGIVFNLMLVLLGLLALVFLLILISYFVNLWLGAPWGYVINLALFAVVFILLKSKESEVKLRLQKEIEKSMEKMDI